MDAHSVVPEPTPDKPAVSFRSRQRHRELLGGISKATEWRLIKEDPDHPKPIPMPPGDQTKAYVEAESDRYLEIVLARQRQNGDGGA
jgi:predicted DNA-binding transcriptional regulator AlpA